MFPDAGGQKMLFGVSQWGRAEEHAIEQHLLTFIPAMMRKK